MRRGVWPTLGAGHWHRHWTVASTQGAAGGTVGGRDPRGRPSLPGGPRASCGWPGDGGRGGGWAAVGAPGQRLFVFFLERREPCLWA